MARRQPEGVIDRAAGQAVAGWSEGWWLLRLLPAAAQIGGAKDRRPQVAGLGRRQQRAAVTRIHLHMADGVAQEVRPIKRPGLALAITVEEPGPLARRHQDDEAC